MTAHPAGRHATTRGRHGRAPRPAAGGYLLALDAGTGSCRAILFDLAGRQVAVAQREWSHPPVGGIAGSQNFDTAANWALICGCIRQVLGSVADPGAVLAVGCSSMGGGLVLYDRAGREIWACANGDARARREAEAQLASGMAARLYDLGGGWISLAAPPRLAWIRQHRPALWAAGGKLSMIADWMVYRLTGTLVTEPSVGSTSGMFEREVEPTDGSVTSVPVSRYTIQSAIMLSLPPAAHSAGRCCRIQARRGGAASEIQPPPRSYSRAAIPLASCASASRRARASPLAQAQISRPARS